MYFGLNITPILITGQSISGNHDGVNGFLGACYSLKYISFTSKFTCIIDQSAWHSLILNYATKIILFRWKTSGKIRKNKDSADLLTKSNISMWFYVQLIVIFYRNVHNWRKRKLDSIKFATPQDQWNNNWSFITGKTIYNNSGGNLQNIAVSAQDKITELS